MSSLTGFASSLPPKARADRAFYLKIALCEYALLSVDKLTAKSSALRELTPRTKSVASAYSVPTPDPLRHQFQFPGSAVRLVFFLLSLVDADWATLLFVSIWLLFQYFTSQLMGASFLFNPSLVVSQGAPSPAPTT